MYIGALIDEIIKEAQKDLETDDELDITFYSNVIDTILPELKKVISPEIKIKTVGIAESAHIELFKDSKKICSLELEWDDKYAPSSEQDFKNIVAFWYNNKGEMIRVKNPIPAISLYGPNIYGVSFENTPKGWEIFRESFKEHTDQYREQAKSPLSQHTGNQQSIKKYEFTLSDDVTGILSDLKDAEGNRTGYKIQISGVFRPMGIEGEFKSGSQIIRELQALWKKIDKEAI